MLKRAECAGFGGQRVYVYRTNTSSNPSQREFSCSTVHLGEITECTAPVTQAHTSGQAASAGG